MKTILNIHDQDSRFREMINENVDFINRQCLKTIKLKSGRFLKGELNIENESDRLFNRVIDKLTDNGFAILKKFEGRSKLSTYLTAIIVRTAIDLIRERAGRERAGDESGKKPERKIPDTAGTPVKNGISSGNEDEYIVPDRVNIPEVRILENDRGKRMGDALSLMLEMINGEEKLLLRMKFPINDRDEPMSTKEIAGALGVSVKGVYNRLDRLLEKCRKIMEQAGIGAEDFISAEFKGNVRPIKRRE